MKIAMLARNPELYSHKRICQAATERGHEINVINTTRCYMNMASHKPRVYYQGAPLEGYDAVIPRIGASITFYGCAVVRQFEMKRQGAEGDFRSNLHRGGSATKIRITPEERSTAARAAKIMGLNVCGVDLLRSNHGPVVMEVNSTPGLEGIEEATGVDVAGKVIEFIEKNAKPNRTRTKGTG